MNTVDFVSRSIIKQSKNLEAHFVDYDKELLKTVFRILNEEREHRIAKSNITKKIQDCLEDLGYQIERRST